MNSDHDGFDEAGLEPGELDDALARILAEGADEESAEDDDEYEYCPHPWHSLEAFEVENLLVLGCEVCDEHWELPDEPVVHAMFTAWQSSQHAFHELTHRLEVLERFVGKSLGTHACECCGDLVTGSGPLAGVEVIEGQWSCVNHLGAVLDHHAPLGKALPRVAAYAIEQGWTRSMHPWDRFQFERIVSVAPIFAKLMRQGERTAYKTMLRLHPAVARAIEVEECSSMIVVAKAVAKALDLPTPKSRSGVAFMLGLAGAVQRVMEKHHVHDPDWDGAELDPTERVVREMHTELRPGGRAVADELVSDLLRDASLEQGSDEGRTLLHAVVDRALSELLAKANAG